MEKEIEEIWTIQATTIKSPKTGNEIPMVKLIVNSCLDKLACKALGELLIDISEKL